MVIVYKLWNVLLCQINVQILSKKWLQKKRLLDRCEQGSNLRGKIPLDFKSNALTSRPSQLKELSDRRKPKPGFQPKQKSPLQV